MFAFIRGNTLVQLQGQGTIDDRVSNNAMVWKIYEKNAAGVITEFLDGGKSPIDTTLTAAMLDDNRTTIQNTNGQPQENGIIPKQLPLGAMRMNLTMT